MRQAFVRAAPIALAAGLMAALGACSAASIGDQLPPTLGGLPAGAPARPATPYEYPAVHDMPPPRATRTMTEEELIKAEKDLQAARDRQEAKEVRGKKAATAARKPATPAAKKQPADGNRGQGTGAKTNP